MREKDGGGRERLRKGRGEIETRDGRKEERKEGRREERKKEKKKGREQSNEHHLAVGT